MKKRDHGAIIGAILLGLITCASAVTAVLSFIRAEQAALTVAVAMRKISDITAERDHRQKALEFLAEKLGQTGITDADLLCRRVDEALSKHGTDSSYPMLISRLQLRIETERKRGEQFKEEALTQKKRADNAGPNFNARMEVIENALKNKEKELVEERKTSHELLSKFESKIESLQEQLATANDLRRQEQRDHEIAMGKNIQKLNSLKAAVRGMREQEEAVNPNGGTAPRDNIVAKVVTTDYADKTVTINAGRDDSIRQGMRLQLYRPDQFGKPSQMVATIEVARLDRGSSLAKIISNDVRTPILAGDLAVNALSSQGRPEMVALVGKLDEDGDGQDDTDRIERFVKKQGGRVLCRLLPNGQMIGRITPQLTYVVMDMPEVSDERTTEETRQLLEKLSLIRKEATELGVRIVGSRKFLREIGYKFDLRAASP